MSYTYDMSGRVPHTQFVLLIPLIPHLTSTTPEFIHNGAQNLLPQSPRENLLSPPIQVPESDPVAPEA